MKTIAPTELHRLLTDQPSLPLIDVRTPAEYAEVHAPAAINKPLDSLDPAAIYAGEGIPADQPVYLICRTDNRSRMAAAKFSKAGFDQSVIVDGGTLAWLDAGLPAIRGAARAISLERQVRIAAGSLVVAGVLLAWLAHPAFILLPAFVGSGLVFAGITDFCGMGLLLARLPWNRRGAA